MLLGALVQLGSVVVMLVYGFGLDVKDWGWILAAGLVFVFGRGAVVAVIGLKEVPRA